MKYLMTALILVLMACTIGNSAVPSTQPATAPATRPKAGPEDVVVKKLAEPLPDDSEDQDLAPGTWKQNRFLWQFANQQQFNHYTEKNWQENYKQFSAVLIRKAKAAGLNSESLGKVLDAVLAHSNKKIAYLPVGAYSTTLKGSPVWIVIVKWEFVSVKEREYEGKVMISILGHIRMFAYDQKTLKLVAYSTCS